MVIVSTSYSKTSSFSKPLEWLYRIRFYTGILEELAKQHKVISIERINYEGYLEQNNVQYRFMDLETNVILFPRRMHRYIQSLQPDVVLVNGLIFPVQVIQLRKALGNKPKILLLHRGEKRPSKGLKGWLQKKADKCVNAYLFSSMEFAVEWKRNISEEKIVEIAQATSIFRRIERQRARESLQIGEGLILLWVGRLEKNKNPVTVVKAFLQFLKVYPSARLYMIYQAEELIEEIRSMISGVGQIILVGKVEHAGMQNWYSSADLIISGSYHEGNGIAILEAMSCGCIPVLTNIPSFRKMTDGRCGILYNAGDENDLLVTLQQLLKRDMEVERQKVIERFQQEYSFEAIGEKIGRLISKLNSGQS